MLMVYSSENVGFFVTRPEDKIKVFLPMYIYICLYVCMYPSSIYLLPMYLSPILFVCMFIHFRGNHTFKDRGNLGNDNIFSYQIALE